MICPLCKSQDTDFLHKDNVRQYYRCTNCFLIFVTPEYYLSHDAEGREYDNHQNSPDDPEYRRFLSRLFNPLNEMLSAEKRGLDFGSGPGPTLSLMFQEAGHTMEIYDPFYANDKSALEKQYNFITATEVVEHFYRPIEEFERLWSMLKPSGHLGIMTKLVLDSGKFPGWHYTSEPSHVCFYSKETFEWLSEKLNAQLTILGEDVVILKKGTE